MRKEGEDGGEQESDEPGAGTVDRGGVPPTCDASEAFVVVF